MYKVNIDNGRNELYKCKRTEFEVGEPVEFWVPLPSDENVTVSSDNVVITKDYQNSRLYCSFSMPAHDVIVTIKKDSRMMCNQEYRQGFTVANMSGSQQPAIPQKDAMYCYECGAFLPVQARFCSNCGKRCRE